MSDGPDSARRVGQIVLPRTVLPPLQRPFILSNLTHKNRVGVVKRAAHITHAFLPFQIPQKTQGKAPYVHAG